MTFKYLVVIAFGLSLIGMWLTTYMTGKNTIEDAKLAFEKLPGWKKLIYASLEIYPSHLLSETGKKWQLATHFLLVLALCSGISIGYLVKT